MKTPTKSPAKLTKLKGSFKKSDDHQKSPGTKVQGILDIRKIQNKSDLVKVNQMKQLNREDSDEKIYPVPDTEPGHDSKKALALQLNITNIENMQETINEYDPGTMSDSRNIREIGKFPSRRTLDNPQITKTDVDIRVQMTSTGYKNAKIGLPKITNLGLRKNTLSPEMSPKAFTDVRNTRMNFFNDFNHKLQKELGASDALQLKEESSLRESPQLSMAKSKMIKFDMLNPQNKLADVSFAQKVLGNANKVDHSLKKHFLTTNKTLIERNKNPAKHPSYQLKRVIQDFQDAAYINFKQGGDTREYCQRIRNSVAHNSHLSFQSRNASIVTVNSQKDPANQTLYNSINHMNSKNRKQSMQIHSISQNHVESKDYFEQQLASHSRLPSISENPKIVLESPLKGKEPKKSIFNQESVQQLHNSKLGYAGAQAIQQDSQLKLNEQDLKSQFQMGERRISVSPLIAGKLKDNYYQSHIQLNKLNGQQGRNQKKLNDYVGAQFQTLPDQQSKSRLLGPISPDQKREKQFQDFQNLLTKNNSPNPISGVRTTIKQKVKNRDFNNNSAMMRLNNSIGFKSIQGVTFDGANLQFGGVQNSSPHNSSFNRTSQQVTLTSPTRSGRNSPGMQPKKRQVALTSNLPFINLNNGKDIEDENYGPENLNFLQKMQNQSDQNKFNNLDEVQEYSLPGGNLQMNTGDSKQRQDNGIDYGSDVSGADQMSLMNPKLIQNIRNRPIFKTSPKKDSRMDKSKMNTPPMSQTQFNFNLQNRELQVQGEQKHLGKKPKNFRMEHQLTDNEGPRDRDSQRFILQQENAVSIESTNRASVLRSKLPESPLRTSSKEFLEQVPQMQIDINKVYDTLATDSGGIRGQHSDFLQHNETLEGTIEKEQEKVVNDFNATPNVEHVIEMKLNPNLAKYSTQKPKKEHRNQERFKMIKNQLQERKNMSKIVLVFDGKNKSPDRSGRQSPVAATGMRPILPVRTQQKIKPIKINEIDISSEFRDDVESSKRIEEQMDSDAAKGVITNQSSAQYLHGQMLSSKTSPHRSFNQDLILEQRDSRIGSKKLNYVNLVVNTSNQLNSDMYETKSPTMMLTSDFPTATMGVTITGKDHKKSNINFVDNKDGQSGSPSKYSKNDSISKMANTMGLQLNVNGKNSETLKQGRVQVLQSKISKSQLRVKTGASNDGSKDDYVLSEEEAHDETNGSKSRSLRVSQELSPMKTAMQNKFNDKDRLQDEGQIDQWDIKSTGDGDPDVAFKKDARKPNKSSIKVSALKKDARKTEESFSTSKDKDRKMLATKLPSKFGSKLKINLSSQNVSNTGKKKSKAPIVQKNIDSDDSLQALAEASANDTFHNDSSAGVFKNKMIKDMQSVSHKSAIKQMELSDN